MATLARGRSAAAARAGQRERRAGHDFWSAVRISVFAISLGALWTPLNTLVLPHRVDALAPEALRGTALGVITFVGIGLAAVIQPVAGLISDRTRLPDRRRPFIVLPALAMAALLLSVPWLPAFGLLLAVYVVLQLASNTAQAAFQALVPDLVPEETEGTASGVKTGFDVLGTAVGLGVAGVAITLGFGDRGTVAGAALLVLLGAWLTWRWVPPVRPEQESPGLPAAPARWGGFVREAFAPLAKGSRAFRLTVLARFLFLAGLYPVQRFLLFYLEDRFDLKDPAGLAAIAILGAILVAAAGAGIAGILTDRVPAKTVLRVSTAVAVIGLLGIAFLPSLVLIAPAGCVLAFGAGAFQASSWALVARTVPDGMGADQFGVANIATAGASAVAGLLGPLVDLANRFVPAGTYETTFSLCALVTLACLWPVAKLEDTRGSSEH